MRYRLESLYDDVAQIQHETRDLFGSGRLIGNNLILTARHVLTEEDRSAPLSEGWKVRLIATRPEPPSTGVWQWIRARTEWVGQGTLDLALLRLIPEEPAICLHPKLKLRIAQIERVEHHLVRGPGFPRGAKIDNKRVLFVPSGHLDDEKGPTLTFGVDQAYQPESPGADWRGFSGTSVVLEESNNIDEVWVYGVAQHVPPNFTRQLAVARLASAFEDALFRAVLESAQVSLDPPADPYLTEQALAHWPSACDFTAYINERREHFSGRKWLFSKVSQWLEKPYPRALLVSADYGVGKSAFMAQLLRRAESGNSVPAKIIGWHFCRHDLSATLTPSVFVSSLSAQLAKHLPDYRAAIEAQPALLEKLEKAGEDPGGTLEAVVLNPLAKLPAPARPTLILVDALDEALEYGNSANIVSLLASRANLFPSWLRILATSRNNPDVIGPLQAFGLEQINAEETDNLEDIYDYVMQHCQHERLAGMLKAAGKTRKEIASMLRDRSGGKFLYAVRVLGDVINGHIDLRDASALPLSMDNFYKNAFERRFSCANCDYEPTRRLLGMIAAAREPLSVPILAEMLQTTEDEVVELREPLADFIRLRQDSFAFDHFSLSEWLTRKDSERRSRAGMFAVRLAESRKVLTEWAWGRAQKDLQQAPAYVLRHLPAHLLELNDVARVHGLLCRFDWQYAKLQRLGMQAVLADFELLPPDIKKIPGIHLLYQTLRMCTHILDRMPEQLAIQLLGRLRGDLAPEIDMLREAAWNWHAKVWLRPIRACMRAPGALLRVLKEHTDSVMSVAFSPDGSHIVSGSRDHTLRLWDAGTGQALGAPLEGHIYWVTSVAFSPDGSRIVSGSWDHTLRLWDAGTGQALGAPLEGHTGEVTSVAFSPDGSRIVSGDRDTILYLWDGLSDNILAKAYCDEQIDCLAVHDTLIATPSRKYGAQVFCMINSDTTPDK